MEPAASRSLELIDDRELIREARNHDLTVSAEALEDLVLPEMLCVSPTGRITPGCAGLWEEGQVEAVAADRPLRPLELGRLHRCPARPVGPQGLDQAPVGGRRPAPGERELAADRTLAALVPAGLAASA